MGETPFASVPFPDLVTKLLENTLVGLRVLNEGKYTHSEENKALVLGNSLGELLSICEYGLTDKEPLPSKNSAEVLAIVQEIITILKQLGKQVKPSFIGSRVKKISKKHSGKLSPEKQQLFAKIAAEFSK